MTRPLGLYIHLPWCQRKCPFCDFNAHVHHQPIHWQDEADALLADLAADRMLWLTEIGQLSPLTSIYFGGGTPTLYPPAFFDHLLQQINRCWPIATQAEITIEAHPGNRYPLVHYRQAGINRVSLGIQSMQDKYLDILSRQHRRQENLDCLNELAEGNLFDSWNVDLMYGLPQQTVQDALSDLNELLDWQPPHLSWYQMTLENNTLWSKNPPPNLPTEIDLSLIEQNGRKQLLTHGYDRYEISAFAKPWHQCQHNLTYWRFDDYLGIGPGASGKWTYHDKIYRTHKWKTPRNYFSKVQQQHNVRQIHQIKTKDIVFEALLNSFRLAEGADKTNWNKRTHHVWQDLIALARPQLEQQWLIQENDCLRVNPTYWDFLDSILLDWMN